MKFSIKSNNLSDNNLKRNCAEMSVSKAISIIKENLFSSSLFYEHLTLNGEISEEILPYYLNINEDNYNPSDSEQEYLFNQLLYDIISTSKITSINKILLSEIQEILINNLVIKFNYPPNNEHADRISISLINKSNNEILSQYQIAKKSTLSINDMNFIASLVVDGPAFIIFDLLLFDARTIIFK